jgi:hypothetical protein
MRPYEACTITNYYGQTPVKPQGRDFAVGVASRPLIHPDLFGLFTVCLMKPYPGVFEIKTYADMDVFKAEYADACEILGSVLGGTYGQGQ